MPLDTDPFPRFQALFARAGTDAPFDHTAMTLATSDAAGQPSARIVLLHGLDARGFVFYTNYQSRKGRAIVENPQAALCFYWPWLDEQVRVEGVLAAIDPAESDAYFASRPRGKQLGAWASRQSEPLASREALVVRVAELEAQYAGRDVPRPPHWGGYRLTPERIEFWKNGEDRLHDRFLYTREQDGWTLQRLYP
jgi:pyridoxamine 5'-phosphate oxidase